MIRKRAYGENARKCRMQFMASRRERDEIEREAQKRGCSVSELVAMVITTNVMPAEGKPR